MQQRELDLERPPWGMAIDRVISDFVAGASEQLVVEAWERDHPDLVLADVRSYRSGGHCVSVDVVSGVTQTGYVTPVRSSDAAHRRRCVSASWERPLELTITGWPRFSMKPSGP